MTDAEKREAAHQFINRWMGRAMRMKMVVLIGWNFYPM